jgi:hypothetical protein
MTSGVYKLTFGDKVYIGRSSNIEHRFTAHISDIKLEKSSKKLINAYKEHGLPFLEIIINEPDLAKQKELEIEFINKFNSVTEGLNTTYGGEDILYGELNVNSKHTNLQIYEVLKHLAYSKDMTLLQISENTKVTLPVVRDISAGKSHIWLSIEYPLEYSIMVENKEYRIKRKLLNLTDKHRFKSNLDNYPKLISPTGQIVEIQGSLSSFANLNNLQIANLSSVLHGKRKSHKGWKLATES